MPVPTLLTDLSATIASNSPAGSDNVFPDLDGYLRSLSGFLASIRDNSGNGWVSPYLSAANPSYTGTLTGGTGVVNLGSGQFYKSATGDVGIGTASPGAKLQVTAAAAYPIRVNATAGTTAGIEFEDPTTGTNRPNIASRGVALAFETNSAERMRLDASGNLGLGVTPSAWGSSYKALQVSSGASYAGSSNAAFWYCNAYNDNTNWRYVTSTNASGYTQFGGVHSWFTAPSGTAGNAISFTQAMTLTGGATTELRLASSADLTTGAGLSILRLGGSNSATSGYIGYGGTSSTIDLWNTLSGSISFGTNNTEKARITSGGDLLVGTTSASLSNSGSFIFAVGASAYGGALAVNHSTSNVNGSGYINFGYDGSAIGSISQNGTTAVAYNTSSDYRLKDNPQPLTNSGAFIDALQPKTWNWKTDGSRGVGFIAHEAQAVSPGSVVGEKDAVDADGKPVMQAMEYGSAEFIANIIAELQSLRARVAALEA